MMGNSVRREVGHSSRHGWRKSDVQQSASKSVRLPELHQAIKDQKIITVNLLLYGTGVNLKKVLNTTDDKGTSALHYAVELGSLMFVKTLVEAGANINKKDLCTMTPLHIAAGGGQTEILKYFLKMESCISWNDKDIWGWTPLHRAIINHHLDGAMLLLDRGCCVNVPDENKRVALHVAGSYGHLELTKKLLDCTAKIDWQDARGRTALYLAVVGRHVEVVQELIRRGCNMNLSTTSRVTPLGLAAQKGHYECVHALITSGAKCCNQRINNTDTVPLESALLRSSNQDAKKYEQFRDIVKMLIQADGDPPSSQSFFIALHALQGHPTDDMLHILQLLLCAQVQPSVPVLKLQGNPAEEIVNTMVTYYLRSCLSLQDICRQSIRHHLQCLHGNVVYAMTKYKTLPCQLKDCILLQDLYTPSIQSTNSI